MSVHAAAAAAASQCRDVSQPINLLSANPSAVLCCAVSGSYPAMSASGIRSRHGAGQAALATGRLCFSARWRTSYSAVASVLRSQHCCPCLSDLTDGAICHLSSAICSASVSATPSGRHQKRKQLTELHGGAREGRPSHIIADDATRLAPKSRLQSAYRQIGLICPPHRRPCGHKAQATIAAGLGYHHSAILHNLPNLLPPSPSLHSTTLNTCPASQLSDTLPPWPDGCFVLEPVCSEQEGQTEKQFASLSLSTRQLIPGQPGRRTLAGAARGRGKGSVHCPEQLVSVHGVHASGT